MKKLLENEENFLKEVEKAVESLKEGITEIESNEAIDDSSKAYLTEETINLSESLKNLYKDHRRFYTILRKTLLFGKFVENSEK